MVPTYLFIPYQIWINTEPILFRIHVYGSAPRLQNHTGNLPVGLLVLNRYRLTTQKQGWLQHHSWRKCRKGRKNKGILLSHCPSKKKIEIPTGNSPSLRLVSLKSLNRSSKKTLCKFVSQRKPITRIKSLSISQDIQSVLPSKIRMVQQHMRDGSAYLPIPEVTLSKTIHLLIFSYWDNKARKTLFFLITIDSYSIWTMKK